MFQIKIIMVKFWKSKDIILTCTIYSSFVQGIPVLYEPTWVQQKRPAMTANTPTRLQSDSTYIRHQWSQYNAVSQLVLPAEVLTQLPFGWWHVVCTSPSNGQGATANGPLRRPLGSYSGCTPGFLIWARRSVGAEIFHFVGFLLPDINHQNKTFCSHLVHASATYHPCPACPIDTCSHLLLD